MKNNEGLLFIDIITPSDIAFVVSVIKNSQKVWDQKIRLAKSGAALPPSEREVKLRPLFTEGTGKKKEQGRTLWSDDGIRYFKRAEKNWSEVYKNEQTMRDIYEGFNNWLSEYGKELTVAKNSNKTLLSVMARWTARGKRNLDKNAETEGIESDDDDKDEGYSLDKGTNLLSKTWSKEEREKQKRNDKQRSNNNVGNNEKSDKRKKGGLKGNDISGRKETIGSPANSDSPRRSNRRTREW